MRWLALGLTAAGTVATVWLIGGPVGIVLGIVVLLLGCILSAVLALWGRSVELEEMVLHHLSILSREAQLSRERQRTLDRERML